MSETTAVQPQAAQRHGPRTLRRRTEIILGCVGVVGLIAVWQVAIGSGAVSERVLPTPLAVAAALGELLTSAAFWLATWQTVWVTVVGMCVIMVIAIPLSIAIHSSRFVDRSTWFLIEFLKPIPGVALIPLALLLWGLTDGVKLFLIVFGALWPILTQLIYGLREISGVALDMGRVYRLTTLQRVRWLTVPSMMPFTITGLRISVTIALIVAVVTEYIAGIPGLGTLLATAQLNGATAQAFALLFVSGILGLAFSGGVDALGRPLLFWHPSQRERAAS